MEVQVNADSLPGAPVAAVSEAVRYTLSEEGAGGAEISVTLLSDDGIRAMNRQYLNIDGPTDVIAFSLGDAERPLGDVYVGFEQATRQAVEHGVSLTEELARLAIHGTLHVLGYDHPEGEERLESPMFERQEQLLSEVLGR